MDIIKSNSIHREIVVSKNAVKAMLVTSFVIMTALGAYVRVPIPFTPVPITLQTFFVILSGAFLGKKLGLFTQASYIGLGVLGMPIFQGYGFGLAHLAGPTGGYLVGFAVGAFLVGALLDKKETSFAYIAFSMFAGIIVIYFLGLSWLMISLKLNLTTALSFGFFPFLPGAILKFIAATMIYQKLKPRVESTIK